MALVLELAFPLPGGLHARPASSIQEVARPFSCAVTLTNLRTGRRANARSILALVATDTRHGDPCRLECDGDDEAAACDALRTFVTAVLPGCDAPLRPAAPSSGLAPLPRALVGAPLLRGLPVAGGIAGAPVVRLEPWATVVPPNAPAGSPADEAAALGAAMDRVGSDLRARVEASAGPTERAILAAHLGLLEDVELRAHLEAAVAAGAPAALAVENGAAHFAAMLRASGSTLLAARAVDLQEVAAALLVALGGRRTETVLEAAAVCVADELGPATLLGLDPRHLKGLVLGRGGATSHAAILARAAGIPCVAGIATAADVLAPGVRVVVDGDRGLVAPQPPPEVEAFFVRERERRQRIENRLASWRDRPARTADGRRLEVAGNAASPEEVAAAIESGGEGIGLYRTELLLAGRSGPPSEDEFTASYAEAITAAAGRPLILRTLDVGGDKPLPWLGLPAEANPFLGVRGVRLYGELEGLVGAQIRAALRASVHGALRLMAPMVATVAEARGFRVLVEREMATLRAAAIPFDEELEIGVMVEVPAAALAVDRLSEVADFFSIGSNDLLQYTLAADRGEARLAELCNPMHPAFLRLLERAVADAHARDRWIGLCGEMAGDERVLPLLVGLGLDELSVAPPRIGRIKASLAELDSRACRTLLEDAMAAEGPAEVEGLLARAAHARRRPLVDADAVLLRSQAGGTTEAIRELVGLLELGGRIDDVDRVEDAVWRREEVHPTCVGFGVAVPHCASPQVRAASLAVARYATPVDWAPGSGEEVGLAILIAVPENGGAEHLRLIAALARRLMDDELREALRTATDEAEVAALLADAAGQGET